MPPCGRVEVHAGSAGPVTPSAARADWIGRVVAAIALVALVFLAVPVVGLLIGSLIGDGDGRLSAANYAHVFAIGRFTGVAWNTLVLGGGSVVVMMLIATPLAWLYARTDFRWKGTLLVAVTAQIATPGFLVALGYVFLLNPANGLVNAWWRAATGSTDALVNVYSMGWLVLLQGLSLVGPAFYFLAPALASIDGSLEEAARVHGVGTFRTMLRVLLPTAKPMLIGTAVFFFLVSVEVFDFAGVLGMPARIDVLATWIYQFTQSSTGVPQYGQAAAVGVLTGLPLIGFMVVKDRFTRDADRLATIGGRRRAAVVILGRRNQAVATSALAAFMLVCFVLPVGMLLWTSLLPYPQMPSRQALQALSLDGYGSAFWSELANVGTTTALVVLMVPTLVVVLSICLSWVARQSGRVVAHGVDAAVLGSLAVPSIVMAVAFAILALQLHASVPLYGTLALLVIAIATRYVATANRITGGVLGQIREELLEAGRVGGVAAGRAFVAVVLPLAASGLLFAWFWVALIVLRELPITLILGGNDLQTLASRIFLYNTAGETRQASALSMAHLAVIGAMLVAFLRLTRAQRMRS